MYDLAIKGQYSCFAFPFFREIFFEKRYEKKRECK